MLGDVLACARDCGSVPVFSAASQLRALAWWRRGALSEVEADARQALQGVGYHATPHGALALVEALLARGDVAAAAQTWRDAGLDAEREYGFSAIMRLHTRARLMRARPCSGRARRPARMRAAPGRVGRPDAGRRQLARRRGRDPRPTRACFGGADAGHRGARRRQRVRVRADARRRPAGGGRSSPASAGSRCCATRWRCSSRPRRGSSTRSRCSSSAPRRAARGSGRTHGVRCATRSRSPRSAARTRRPRAHEELVAAGARPRRDPVESRSNLTASELPSRGWRRTG